MLSFQRLDVYQRAIQFLAFASEVVEGLPRVKIVAPAAIERYLATP